MPFELTLVQEVPPLVLRKIPAKALASTVVPLTVMAEMPLPSSPRPTLQDAPPSLVMKVRPSGPPIFPKLLVPAVAATTCCALVGSMASALMDSEGKFRVNGSQCGGTPVTLALTVFQIPPLTAPA